MRTRTLARRARPRIGVNLLWLVPHDVGGTEEYTTGLVRHLAGTGDVDLVVFCQPSLRDTYPGLDTAAELVVSPSCRGSRARRLLIESTWLRTQADRHGIDVIHHLGGTIPPASVRPSVLTLYDLQPLTHPERFNHLKRLWLRAAVPRSVRRANIVHTLTHHVRRQLVDHLGVPPRRIVVAPPGASDAANPEPGATNALRRRHGIAGPILLYPAISYPHKNHEVLVRALPAVLAHRPDATVVFTGRAGPQDAVLADLARRSGVEHAIRRLGRIPRHDLDALYRAATALVFPSIHEGFGLPLLEAMVHRCPVLAANASAVPEVVEGNGLLLDPHDPAAWADAIIELLHAPERQQALARASALGARRFTWHRATATLAAAYQHLAQARDRPTLETPLVADVERHPGLGERAAPREAVIGDEPPDDAL
jgi:glycosyltransferase involved in cell wall biosynthesis